MLQLWTLLLHSPTSTWTEECLHTGNSAYLPWMASLCFSPVVRKTRHDVMGNADPTHGQQGITLALHRLTTTIPCWGNQLNVGPWRSLPLPCALADGGFRAQTSGRAGWAYCNCHARISRILQFMPVTFEYFIDETGCCQLGCLIGLAWCVSV